MDRARHGNPRLSSNSRIGERIRGTQPRPIISSLNTPRHKTWDNRGIECAIGHTLVEFPLVIGLAIGLQTILQSVANYIALAGGAVLLIFGSLQLLEATKKFEFDPAKPPGPWAERNGIVSGIAFTVLNPFLILWWGTVGATLTNEALALGAFPGVLAMFAAHIWMDYAWLGGTATLVGHGKLILGKWYRILLVSFGVAMIYFGISFILSTLT